MNEIGNLISTVGFPIVAYGAMFWYTIQLVKTHKSEVSELSNAVSNNTQAIQELIILIQSQNSGGNDNDEQDTMVRD